jgi:hypothetical protein
MVKEAKSEKEHKGGDFMEEEMSEPQHKGESKKEVVKKEFGTEARAAKVAKMLKK